MKRILPLVAIEISVWLMLLAITFAISKIAFAIDFGTATLVDRIATQTARLSLSAALIVVWLVAWKRVADYYLARTLSRRLASS